MIKKISFFILALLLIPSVCFAAIGAACVWEVRTAGNAANGGGFDSSVAVPGTDLSQQDAAEDSGTDLTCTDGDAAAPVIASVTHNFVEADEGNIINITEAGTGFTVGRYVIKDTSLNTATLDRACGANGALTGGDWSLGGALNGVTPILATVVAGNIVYILNGTYAEALDTGVAGGNGTPIIYCGYSVTRSIYVFTATQPVFDGESTRANGILADQGGNLFINLSATGGTGDGIASSSGSTGYRLFINCKSYSNGADGFDIVSSGQIEAISCEAYSNSGKGFNAQANYMKFCYAHNNTGSGFGLTGTNTANIEFNIADSNSGAGITLTSGGVHLFGNIAYNNTGAAIDGFILAGGNSSSPFLCLNNISKDNGRYAFTRASTAYGFHYFDYNIYNGHATELNNVTAGLHDPGDTDPLFTDAANADFTFQAGSPALDAGFTLSTVTNVVGVYKWNTGVDQDDNTASTSGGAASGGMMNF